MKYYLIAGEASGDLHGANLIRGLRESDPDAEFRFWGGDRMAKAGGTENLDQHYRKASFFGITEIVRNLRTILSQIKECRRQVEAFAPDVLILIDYPGFNLRMARFAHERGIRVFYYISPKVWAWKQRRVKSLRRWVDQLFIIFPFEREYFRRHGIEAIYEGNPLMDSIAEYRERQPSREEFMVAAGLTATVSGSVAPNVSAPGASGLADAGPNTTAPGVGGLDAIGPKNAGAAGPDGRPIVALLAGSRTSEVRRSLPFMVELAREFPDYRFVVAAVPWLDAGLYERLLAGSDVGYVCGHTYDVLTYAAAAVVTSGTATLETALLGTPEVVCYRTDALSAAVGRLLIKIRFISLVNLVMDREVVRELIQGDMNIATATAELRAILPGGANRRRMLADFELLLSEIGGPGASRRFAALMVEILKNNEKA